MNFAQLIAVPVILSLLGLVALFFYYSVRLKRFEPASSADRVFRCDSCSNLYTDDSDVDLSRCPRCGGYNAPWHFG